MKDRGSFTELGEREKECRVFAQESDSIHEWAKGAITEFKATRDFAFFALSLKQKFESLDKNNGRYSMLPLYFSVLVTDTISEKWDLFNRFILERASRLGIKPQGNFMGERLGAASVLAQIIERSLNAKQPSR